MASGTGTAAVTGASGHIGANLIRALVSQGRPVRALVYHDRRALEGVECELVEGDVRDVATLRRAFEGTESVFHLAAHISVLMTDWTFVEKINVQGTRNVVQACLEAGVRRLVHFSSVQAFQAVQANETLDESRPLVDASKAPPYDRSKAASELEVRRGVERGLDAVILNPTCVIGPYDFKPSPFGQALVSIVRGEMPALVRGGFDWVDARDVADCALRADRLAPAGSQYIVAGHWASVLDLARLAGKIRAVRVPWFVCPLSLVRAAAPCATAWARLRGQRPTFTNVMVRALQSQGSPSHAKATRELGYAPRPFEVTLNDTLDWFAEQGVLGRSTRGQPAPAAER